MGVDLRLIPSNNVPHLLARTSRYFLIACEAHIMRHVQVIAMHYSQPTSSLVVCRIL